MPALIDRPFRPSMQGGRNPRRGFPAFQSCFDQAEREGKVQTTRTPSTFDSGEGSEWEKRCGERVAGRGLRSLRWVAMHAPLSLSLGGTGIDWRLAALAGALL